MPNLFPIAESIVQQTRRGAVESGDGLADRSALPRVCEIRAAFHSASFLKNLKIFSRTVKISPKTARILERLQNRYHRPKTVLIDLALKKYEEQI